MSQYSAADAARLDLTIMALWLRMRQETSHPQIAPWLPWDGREIRWRIA